MKRRFCLALVCAQLVLAAGVLTAAQPAPALENGLARTPPMGYNTWNAFGCNINETLIRQTALAMHNNGMQDAGYEYVNLDDCWMNGRSVPSGPAKVAAGRGPDGRLLADPIHFPSGIKALADYVHSLGLKLGIYSDAGTATCQGLAGSLDHEAVDAQTFADWGVDYLKYDNCNDAGLSTRDGHILRYTRMRDALAATARDIVYSICQWGEQQPWTWAADIGNLWRTTVDIGPWFSGRSSSMLSIFRSNVVLAPYAGPGHWNDPDMLEVGTGGFTTLAAPAAPGDSNIKVASVSNQAAGGAIRIGTAAGGDLESAVVSTVGTAGASGTGITLASPLTRSHASSTSVGKSGMSLPESMAHFSLWAVMAAPLIAGTDVVNIAKENLAIYTNDEVIAVNQDPLGIQAAIQSSDSNHWTLVKRLANGDVAVVFFNADTTAAPRSVSFADLGLDASRAYVVRDLWARTTTAARVTLSATVPGHAVKMYRVSSAGPMADLTVSSVGDPGTPTEGDAVTFDAVVANLGSGDAENVAVRFLVDGVQVGADQSVAALAAGGSASVSSDSWSATAGSHTLEVVVDPDEAIVEADEANNSASREFRVLTRADLSPTALSLSPAKVEGGDQVAFHAQVANLGETSAENVVVRFLLDGAQLGAERTLAQLAGGASVDVASDTWSAKHQEGTHTIQVLVDPANTVAESNETNNSATATFLVRGNKVQNGSFEQSSSGSSPDNWTSSGETSYEGGQSTARFLFSVLSRLTRRTAGGAADGLRSVTAGPGGSWTSDPVAVEPGRGYEASVQAAGAGGLLVVEQLAANGTVLASTAKTLLPTGSFTLADLPVTALGAATQLRLVLRGGLLGTTTFDDVWLVEN